MAVQQVKVAEEAEAEPAEEPGLPAALDAEGRVAVPPRSSPSIRPRSWHDQICPDSRKERSQFFSDGEKSIRPISGCLTRL